MKNKMPSPPSHLKHILATGKVLFCLEITQVVITDFPQTTGSKPFELSPEAQGSSYFILFLSKELLLMSQMVMTLYKTE